LTRLCPVCLEYLAKAAWKSASNLEEEDDSILVGCIWMTGSWWKKRELGLHSLFAQYDDRLTRRAANDHYRWEKPWMNRGYSPNLCFRY
jgi:hypothetical protein